METSQPPASGPRLRTLVLAEGVLLAATLGTVLATARTADWSPVELVVALIVLAAVGESLALRAGRVHIGPAFLATVLAMALLGPAPAAVIAVTAMLGPAVRDRIAPHLLLNNVVALTIYSVAGALLLGVLADPQDPHLSAIAVAVAVFAVALAANALNFALIVGYLCVLEGTSLGPAIRRLYLPVLPWQVATAGLAAVTVIAYRDAGLWAIAGLAALLLTYQRFLRALLDLERQRDDLAAQVDELAALHRGVALVMVKTLAMRDPMTARHSAAVARFARATAAALGLPARELELVHTAGLLHDIGKFTFPDRTLSATKLTEEDWALIHEHPQRGADIVRRVRGYEGVADVILNHHERPDGKGYPQGIGGDEVPPAARIIAVADAFDVMTARDSYRQPIGTQAAIAELRRVAGTQLDAHVVEVFVSLVEDGGVAFAHADDADLDAELATERRLSGHVRSVGEVPGS